VAVAARKRLLRIEEYHQMVAAGILAVDERVELIDGEIFEMPPIGIRHAACLRRLIRWFAPRLGADVMLDVQNPLPLPGLRSEPQPDLLLLRAQEDGYSASPPTAADVLLVVEIADSTRVFDRSVKLPLYAAAGLAEAWLVDLPAGELLVCREPGPEVYGAVRSLRRGATVSPLALPDQALPVALLLG
jgi:Uma2 family endonuclease